MKITVTQTQTQKEKDIEFSCLMQFKDVVILATGNDDGLLTGTVTLQND